MNVSDQGLQLILEREGKRNDAYLDSQGIATIGVGHTGPEVHLGLTWTDDQVMGALRCDAHTAELAVVTRVDRALQQYQFDALVSFIFNVGVGAFAASTMLKCLKAGNVEAAAAEFDRWHIPPEITSRRNGEREQFRGNSFQARIDS